VVLHVQGYHDVLFVSILWMVADLLISAATKEDSWSFYIYLRYELYLVSRKENSSFT